jgi:hypothetical protein
MFILPLPFIGLLGVFAVGLLAWSLYNDLHVTTDKRAAQNQYEQQYRDDIALYKKMASIESYVDALCLSDGPKAKGLTPADIDYAYAQEDYDICFKHVFFKPSFQLPFFEDDERDLFSFTKRVKIYRDQMEIYRKKFDKMEAAQKLLSGGGENESPADELTPPDLDIFDDPILTDIEIYKIMRGMQKDIEASCTREKAFFPDGKARPKMTPEREKIEDKSCYAAGIYYRQSLLPYAWWKGLGADVNVHFFRARYEAFEARFPNIKD